MEEEGTEGQSGEEAEEDEDQSVVEDEENEKSVDEEEDFLTFQRGGEGMNLLDQLVPIMDPVDGWQVSCIRYRKE